MSQNNTLFEIHVHGDVKLRDDIGIDEVKAALKPIWNYTGHSNYSKGSQSFYDSEPGLEFDSREKILRMCWTVEGGNDFRPRLDDLCINLNDIAAEGAQIEVTFYDTDYDDEDEENEEESQDDFILLFVGPTPAAIMQAQRNLLVTDTIALLERHFDSSELGSVINEIDKLFENRFVELSNSLNISKPPRGQNGRRPRHLH